MAMKTRSMRRLTGLEVLDLPSQDDPLSQSWSVARSRSQAEVEELMPGLQALVSRGDQGVFRTPTAGAHAHSLIDMFESVVSFQHVAPPRLQLRPIQGIEGGNSARVANVWERIHSITRANPTALRAVMQQGFVAVLLGVDEMSRTLMRFCEVLERALISSVRLDLWRSESSGLIELNAERNPAAVVVVDGVLGAGPHGSVSTGSSLYLPQGASLEIEARLGQMTLLVVELEGLSTDAHSDRALIMAQRHPRLRADLPQTVRTRHKGTGGSVIGRTDLLTEELGVLLGSQGRRRLEAMRRAQMRPRSLPDSAAFLRLLSGDGPRGLRVLLTSRLPGGLVPVDVPAPQLAGGGPLAELDDAERTLLGALSDGAEHKIDVADTTHERSVSPAFLSELLLMGWFDMKLSD